MSLEIVKRNHRETYDTFVSLVNSYIQSNGTRNFELEYGFGGSKAIEMCTSLSFKIDGFEWFRLDYIQDAIEGDMLIVVGDCGNSRVSSLGELIELFNISVSERLGYPPLALQSKGEASYVDDNVHLTNIRPSRRG